LNYIYKLNYVYELYIIKYGYIINNEETNSEFKQKFVLVKMVVHCTIIQFARYHIIVTHPKIGIQLNIMY